MYEVDDRIVKVYGTVVQINPGGSCVVNAEHINELRLDLRFDKYKLRGKKSGITPEMGIEKKQEQLNSELVSDDSLGKKDNRIEEEKEKVVQEQQIHNKIGQGSQLPEIIEETNVEKESLAMDPDAYQGMDDQQELVEEENVEVENNELSTSAEVEQKYSLTQDNNEELQEKEAHVDSVEQKFEMKQSPSRDNDLEISM